MLKIRPHHLLCMQAYVGNGYSEEFVENMSFVVNSLKKDKNQTIYLVASNDDICSKCPNNVDNKKCIHNNKVLSIDKKVTKLLNLETKEYTYSSLLEKLKKNLNAEIFQDICGECDWYKQGICKILFEERGFI